MYGTRNVEDSGLDPLGQQASTTITASFSSVIFRMFARIFVMKVEEIRSQRWSDPPVIYFRC